MKVYLCLFLSMVLVFPLLLTDAKGAEAEVPESRTILKTPDLNLNVLRAMFQGDAWHQVVNIPYDHYVIFHATVRKDRSLRIHSVGETFPDDSRVELARLFAESARLEPVTVGTRVAPSAKICVVFFEKGSSPNESLVYAELTSMAAAAGREWGTSYLNVIYYDLD